MPAHEWETQEAIDEGIIVNNSGQRKSAVMVRYLALNLKNVQQFLMPMASLIQLMMKKRPNCLMQML